MMFRTITVSTLAAMVQAAVIESKPQQHLQKGEGAGKILEAGMAAAAAGALAAAANNMATHGSDSSKSSDDTTTTPGPACNIREILDDLFTGVTPANFCNTCGLDGSSSPTDAECKTDVQQCFNNIEMCTADEFNSLTNPDGDTCDMWLRQAKMGCNGKKDKDGNYKNANKCITYIASLLDANLDSNTCSTNKCKEACTECGKGNGDICM